MKYLAKFIVILFFCFSSLSALAFGNEDVIKLLGAGFAEDVVLNAISTSNPATFDTSANGLIALKKAGASDAVIQKVLARQGGNQPTEKAAVSGTADGNCVIEFPDMDAVPVRAGDKIIGLKSHKPEIVNDTQGGTVLAYMLTFGIAKAKGNTSLGLPGERSSVRMTEKMPEFLNFLFPIPAASPPEDLVFLVHMTVKGNSRVVQIASAEVGLTSSSGRMDFGKDIRIPLVMEKVADQCMSHGKRFSQYRMKPSLPLESGEYGLLVGESILDFAVD